jgi:hypothetical protein
MPSRAGVVRARNPRGSRPDMHSNAARAAAALEDHDA